MTDGTGKQSSSAKDGMKATTWTQSGAVARNTHGASPAPIVATGSGTHGIKSNTPLAKTEKHTTGRKPAKRFITNASTVIELFRITPRNGGCSRMWQCIAKRHRMAWRGT